MSTSFFILFAILFLFTSSGVYSKRNILKRQSGCMCQCTVATATFNDAVTGIIVFSQDTCGSTLVSGLFSQGLNDPDKNRYAFLIVDPCGNVLRNLTSDLNVSYSMNGTLPFETRPDNFNLDCDSSGVLVAGKYCKSTSNSTSTITSTDTYTITSTYTNTSTSKSNCYKRNDDETSVEITQNGAPYANGSLKSQAEASGNITTISATTSTTSAIKHTTISTTSTTSTK